MRPRRIVQGAAPDGAGHVVFWDFVAHGGPPRR
jgi:hypothetical protein